MLALYIILTVLNTSVRILISANPYFIHTVDIELQVSEKGEVVYAC